MQTISPCDQYSTNPATKAATNKSRVGNVLAATKYEYLIKMLLAMLRWAAIVASLGVHGHVWLAINQVSVDFTQSEGV